MFITVPVLCFGNYFFLVVVNAGEIRRDRHLKSDFQADILLSILHVQVHLYCRDLQVHLSCSKHQQPRAET